MYLKKNYCSLSNYQKKIEPVVVSNLTIFISKTEHSDWDGDITSHFVHVGSHWDAPAVKGQTSHGTLDKVVNP